MTTIVLRIMDAGIFLDADIREPNGTPIDYFCALVRPGESYGGMDYEALMHIAATRGEFDSEA